MPEKILRCAIYIRVSTFEQSVHGKSLQAQKECLEQYATDNNMSIVGVYADEGKTARKELKKRKAIHALVEDVKRDKIDVIIFWRLDRWFRNLSDFYKVQDVLDEHGVRWISVSEPGINMETRDGRLQLNVVLSIGQNEVDTTSERIKFVNEASIRQRKLIFGDANMPFGYKTGVVDGKKCMVKDSETEHMVEDFFEYFRNHNSKKGAVRYMQEVYGIDFSYGMLRTMLSSEFYKGTYRGYPYCPAYLSEKEWNEMQTISKRNIKSTPSGRVYLFTGLMRCPVCGQKLVGTGCSSIINRKTGEKRTYCYYRCNRALNEKYLLENLEREYEKYKVRTNQISEELKKQKKAKDPKKLRKEMERLNLLFQKGRISYDYYDKEYQRLEREYSASAAFCEEEETRNLHYVEELLKTDFRQMYDSLSPENKRSFWRSTIQEIYLNDDNTIKAVDFL